MKRIVLGLLAAVLAISSCKNKDEFVINGKLENAPDIKKVLLYENDQLTDSAFLNADHQFEFKRNSPEPNFYSLVIGEKSFLVIAENGDDISFETDYTDKTNTYKIEGSENSEKVRDFNRISNEFGKVTLQLEEQYNKAVASNPAAKDSIYESILPVLQKNIDAFSVEAIKFANGNKDNLAGFYAISTVDPVKYEQQLIQFADDINGKFSKNKAVDAFVTKMTQLKPLSIGKIAPDFEMSSTDGKQVKLSDFKGKYVLLDFWASWCAPCRKENPNIVKQYNSYKDKNFTILGVSLDDKKDAWMQAIQSDKLNWTQVSDLKSWNSKAVELYKLEEIPSSLILDPTGKIVAKNLRGDELETFLKKTL